MRIFLNSNSGGGGRAGGGRGVSANPLVNLGRRLGRFLSSGAGGRLINQISQAIQGAFGG